MGNQVVGAIILSPTDAASQEAVVGSAQPVVVERARAPRDAAVQHCLEYLGSEHPNFELERSARSVVQFEGILAEAAPCVAYAPIDLDGQVNIVVICVAVRRALFEFDTVRSMVMVPWRVEWPTTSK